jgi:hypothetical protein
LQAASAAARPADVAPFAARARERCEAEVRAFTDEVASRTGGSAGPAGRALDLPPAPRRHGGSEARLMAVLGAGFGVGVGTVAARLAAVVLPYPPIAPLGIGATVGLLVAVWLVRMRRLLHDRAALERWSADAAGVVRAALDDVLAAGLLDLTDAAEAQAAAAAVGPVGSEDGTRNPVTDR